MKPRPEPELVAFGQRMREYRGMLGWSQEKLAEVAGRHWSYIGQLERGCYNPTLLTIERVAGALGVTAAQLVSDG